MGEGEDAEEERNRNCARNWWTKPKWTKTSKLMKIKEYPFVIKLTSITKLICLLCVIMTRIRDTPLHVHRRRIENHTHSIDTHLSLSVTYTQTLLNTYIHRLRVHVRLTVGIHFASFSRISDVNPKLSASRESVLPPHFSYVDNQ